MSIKNSVVFRGKGVYKDYEHVFECVDDDRKVAIETTGELICKIKKWLDFFSNNKSDYFQKWDSILKFHLIADGANPHIDEGQYFVKLNYGLLNSNKSLTYNQALFLLLGLNAHELGRSIKDFPTLNGDEPVAQPIEMEFWRTQQNQVLKESAFIDDNGKITSENLELLALSDENNFFTVENGNLNKSKKPRQSTIETQKKIDKIAKQVMLDYPNIGKTDLSVEIEQELLSQFKIPMTSGNIVRSYLDKYPNF